MKIFKSLAVLHGCLISNKKPKTVECCPEELVMIYKAAFWFWLNPNYIKNTAPWDCSRTKNKL